MRNMLPFVFICITVYYVKPGILTFYPSISGCPTTALVWYREKLELWKQSYRIVSTEWNPLFELAWSKFVQLESVRFRPFLSCALMLWERNTRRQDPKTICKFEVSKKWERNNGLRQSSSNLWMAILSLHCSRLLIILLDQSLHREKQFRQLKI